MKPASARLSPARPRAAAANLGLGSRPAQGAGCSEQAACELVAEGGALAGPRELRTRDERGERVGERERERRERERREGRGVSPRGGRGAAEAALGARRQQAPADGARGKAWGSRDLRPATRDFRPMKLRAGESATRRRGRADDHQTGSAARSSFAPPPQCERVAEQRLVPRPSLRLLPGGGGGGGGAKDGPRCCCCRFVSEFVFVFVAASYAMALECARPRE